MFLQNQIDSLPNHLSRIKELLNDVEKLYLSVSYVRNSGVDLLIDDIKKIIDNEGEVRFICSSDMGITQPSAVRRLVEVGVKVRVFKLGAGTFHSKIWLSSSGGDWSCIVGSANLSRGALVSNVEASLSVDKDSNFEGSIEQALMFFEYLWKSEKCVEVDDEVLNAWENRSRSRKKVKKKISEVKLEKEDKEIVDTLFEYVQGWIDISKEKRESSYTQSLWRGWYIIPDQGLINNNEIKHLYDILKILNSYSKDQIVDISKKSSAITDIDSLMEKRRKKDSRKTSNRELFIRHEKNYLISFGLIEHYTKENQARDKSRVVITDTGKEFLKCGKENIGCLKDVYSKHLVEKEWGEIHIIPFSIELLKEVRYITLHELMLFVMHAFSEDDFEDMLFLLNSYRNLQEEKQEYFIKEKFNKYFNKIKSSTAKNVRGNYKKKVKHTASAIGWVKGVNFNEEKNRLELSDAQDAEELLEYFEDIK